MSRPKNRRVERPSTPPGTRIAARSNKQPGSAGRVALISVGITVLVIGTLVGLKIGEPKQPPLERDPAVLAAGEQLFATSCAQCHGVDLKGTDTGPPFLNPTYAPNHHGDEAFQQAAAYGVPPHHWNFGPMPPVVPSLGRDEVSEIVAYVRNAQESAGIWFDPRHG